MSDGRTLWPLGRFYVGGVIASGVAIALALLFYLLGAGIPEQFQPRFLSGVALLSGLGIVLGSLIHRRETQALGALLGGTAPPDAPLVVTAWRELQVYPVRAPFFGAGLTLILTGLLCLFVWRATGDPVDAGFAGAGGVLASLLTAVWIHLLQTRLARGLAGRVLEAARGLVDVSTLPLAPGQLWVRLAYLLGASAVAVMLFVGVLLFDGAVETLGGRLSPEAFRLRVVLVTTLGLVVGLGSTLATLAVVGRTMREIAGTVERLRDRPADTLVTATLGAPELGSLARELDGVFGRLRARDEIRLALVANGRYRPLDILGYGASAAVYRALDESLQRQVALKVIHPYLVREPEDLATQRARLRREVRAAGRLRHPGVVQVYDTGEIEQGEQHYLFIAMELVEGLSLRKRLRDGPLTFAEAVALSRDVAEALAHAHARGVVHRDFKPANILIDGEGGAHLTDFDVAIVDGASTLTGLIGTPQYMSPEQAEERPVTPAADQWALGVVLYESLTGQQPFVRDDPFSTIAAILEAPVPSLAERCSDCPASAADAVHRMLSRRAEDRFPDVRAAVEAFAGASGGDPA
jgi:tRNA A-37 threonylcarbamoyl transferase component Bud32